MHTEFEPDKTFGKVLGFAFIRPFRLLATPPIIMVIDANMAYLFGIVFPLSSTFLGLLGTCIMKVSGQEV